MRGKKRDSTDLSEYFNTLIVENFPDVFNIEPPVQDAIDGSSSSRKRGRSPTNEIVNAESVLEAKRSNRRNSSDNEQVVRLNNAEKTNLKAIIAKLSKVPGADLFLYPVDKK